MATPPCAPTEGGSCSVVPCCHLFCFQFFSFLLFASQCCSLLLILSLFDVVVVRWIEHVALAQGCNFACSRGKVLGLGVGYSWPAGS